MRRLAHTTHLVGAVEMVAGATSRARRSFIDGEHLRAAVGTMSKRWERGCNGDGEDVQEIEDVTLKIEVKSMGPEEVTVRRN
jgi:hypothetical protein